VERPHQTGGTGRVSDLNFLKAVRQLRSGVDAVREIGRVLGENIERVEMDGVPFIHPDNWPQVRAQVRELIAEAQEIDDDLTGCIGDGDDDVIDVQAVDDDDRELPTGN
jgi:hypothetical protein